MHGAIIDPCFDPGGTNLPRRFRLCRKVSLAAPVGRYEFALPVPMAREGRPGRLGSGRGDGNSLARCSVPWQLRSEPLESYGIHLPRNILPPVAGAARPERRGGGGAVDP